MLLMRIKFETLLERKYNNKKDEILQPFLDIDY